MIDIVKFDPMNVQNMLRVLRPFFVYDQGIADWADQYAMGHIDHYQHMIRHIKSIYDLKNIKHLLDIGGVPGHIPTMLKYIGFDIDVVDIRPERSKTLFDSMKIKYYTVDVERETLPFSDNTYDLVIFSEIIEHLRNTPFKALGEVYRVLKPGGICLLSTPQITMLMRWRFLLRHDYQGDIVGEYEKMDTLGHMGHMRLYSKNEIGRILKYLDFNILQIEPGGKLAGNKGDVAAGLFRWFTPHKMRAQIYAWAEKQSKAEDITSANPAMRCFSQDQKR